MNRDQVLHVVRLAQMEAAAHALLREACADHGPNDTPDGVTIRLEADGIDIEYTRGGTPVAGEGI